jgi:hypothetical protein
MIAEFVTFIRFVERGDTWGMTSFAAEVCEACMGYSLDLAIVGLCFSTGGFFGVCGEVAGDE